MSFAFPAVQLLNLGLLFLAAGERLRPGLSALLHLLRWKIETGFEAFETMLHHRRLRVTFA